jgi:hypothetical protein
MHKFEINGVIGHVDQVSVTAIEGWAWDPRHPAGHVSVQLLLDGHLARGVDADIYRTDLEKAGIGQGDHGFYLSLSPEDMNRYPRELGLAINFIRIEGFAIPIHHVKTVSPHDIEQLLFQFVLPNLDRAFSAPVETGWAKKMRQNQ